MQIKETLIEISNNFLNLSNQCSSDIEKVSKIIIKCLANKNKIMFCGNGGSASDSQHLAAELLGRYKINRPSLPALALTTDTSTITAIANDFSYDEIFERQVEALGNTGDVLYAISTSGKSNNIIKAINAAKKKDMIVIGITGEEGGNMNTICSEIIKVPAKSPDRIQEMHIAVGQLICEAIELHFFSKND